jgi:molybdenum cofactor cytidylyltransferase
LLNSSSSGRNEDGVADPEIDALILAAGLSSRMDGFKPLLQIGPKSILEHALDLFCLSAIREIVTVVGHRSAELVPTLRDRRARYVLNENYRAGMFSSIQVGVEALATGCAGFFLLPVDIPLVRQETLRQLIEASAGDPARAIIYPQFQGRCGHPPLISTELVKPILADAGNGGLRTLLRTYRAKALVVPVDDPFILKDVDTTDDLQTLKDLYLQQSSAQ